MSNIRKYSWTFRYEVPRDANMYVTVIVPTLDQLEAQKHAYAKIMLNHEPPVELKALWDMHEVK